MDENQAAKEHPSFTRAKALPEPLRSYFPKNPAEAGVWKPAIWRHALASRVLAVAQTRIECAWSAYCDSVEGSDHSLEQEAVLESGCKLGENVALVLFPHMEGVPYAG